MGSVNYNQQGIVFDFQRYSIHDGPGIRTIIFLKGCPLRCKWCSNPESQKVSPELLFQKTRCIHCNICIETCDLNAIGPENEHWINREICTACGKCAKACPAKALEIKGMLMTVAEVIEIANKDASYYHSSGGGITLSGGEALTQPEFSREILKAAHEMGWHTAMETEGYASTEAIWEVIPHVDLVLLDIKSMDPVLHKIYTGVSNERIIQNANIIPSISDTVIRVPLIPGFNASTGEFRRIVEFVSTLTQVKTLHILPYHNFGENKYGLLGRSYEMTECKTPDEQTVQELKEIVEAYGLICKIGG